MNQVAIIMGSDSDLPVMQPAADFLKSMGISFELTIVSAHRTPQRMMSYATKAKKRGFKVIIAGAGGAAPSARHGRFFKFTSGYWGTDKINKFTGWLGFHPFYITNAVRDSRSYHGAKRVQECRYPRRQHHWCF